MIVQLNYHCSTNSGPPSVKNVWGSVHQCFFFLSPSYTVGQVPLAYLAYPWTVTYIHTYIPASAVTKTGELAGPRKLEHMVDTTLYLEGQMSDNYR